MKSYLNLFRCVLVPVGDIPVTGFFVDVNLVARYELVEPGIEFSAYVREFSAVIKLYAYGIFVEIFPAIVLAFSSMPGDGIEGYELIDFSGSIDYQMSGCFDIGSSKVFGGAESA